MKIFLSILTLFVIFSFIFIGTSYGALPRDHPSLTEISLQYELRNSNGQLIAYYEPTLSYIIDLAMIHENLDSKENKSIVVRDGINYEQIQYVERGILSSFSQYSSYDMIYKGKVYAKINGRYLECTETIEDLEKQIEYLKNKNGSKSGPKVQSFFTISHKPGVPP